MSLFNYQYGGGNCSLCNSPNTNKSTCPLNPGAKNPNKSKHPLAKKNSKMNNSKMNNSNSDKMYEVIYSVNYTRSNDDSVDKDPTEKEFEKYVSQSNHIPEHIDYMDDFVDVDFLDGVSKRGDRFVKNVQYIGNRQFRFRCKTHLSPKEIADAFFHTSLADSEWEASPGNGSFVYPTKDGNELGLIGFDEVIVNGQSFKKKLAYLF